MSDDGDDDDDVRWYFLIWYIFNKYIIIRN